MTEVFNPLTLECGVGNTTATIMVEAGTYLGDNVEGFVVAPCKGCNRWSAKKIKEVEAGANAEWGDRSGIRDGRVNMLEQLLVDSARFNGGEHKLNVSMCTPVTKD